MNMVQRNLVIIFVFVALLCQLYVSAADGQAKNTVAPPSQQQSTPAVVPGPDPAIKKTKSPPVQPTKTPATAPPTTTTTVAPAAPTDATVVSVETTSLNTSETTTNAASKIAYAPAAALFAAILIQMY